MHGDVDAAVQQGLIDLLREEALAADVRQRLVQDLVAGRFDDADLQRALLRQLRVLLLRSGQIVPRFNTPEPPSQGRVHEECCADKQERNEVAKRHCP